MMRTSLKNKIMIPALVVVVVGLGVLSLASYRSSSEALSATITAQVEQIAENRRRFMGAWLADRELDVKTWSNQQVYQTAVQDSFMGKAARAAASNELSKLRNEYGYYESVSLALASGEVVASSEPAEIGTANPLMRDAATQAGNGQVYVSDIFKSPKTGKPVFVIAAPIREGERMAGTLIAELNFEYLAEQYILSVKVGESGYAYAVNRQGLVVAHRERNKVLTENLAQYPAGKAILAEKNGLLTYTRDGKENIEAFRTLQDVGWTVAVGSGTEELLAPARRMGYINLGIAVVVLLAAAGILAWIAQQLAQPIKHIANQLRDIAEGDGDLTVTLDARGADEVIELAQGFNKFVAKIAELVREAKQTTVQLAATADALSSSTERISVNNGSVARESQTMAAASIEMSDTVQEVARNAAHANEASERASVVAQDGSRVISEALSALREIASQMKETGNSVKALEDSFRSIGQVVGIIEGIADQTNLLALNAAIEAARAGESGRGFAVVADEVRNLAGKTVEATKEIAHTIDVTRGQTERAAAAARQGETSVTKGAELGRKAEDAISAISSEVQVTASQISQIATATEQLRIAIFEVANNAEHIAEGINKTKDAVEGISSTAITVANRADELRTLTARFKT